MRRPVIARRMRGMSVFVLVLLAIELLDEFVYGAREAAWPLIRTDLELSYDQIGLLIGVPGLFSTVIEPGLFILSDVWRRRVIVLSGGVLFGLACLITAVSGSFAALMLAFLIFAPASGAFVGLSQTTLMDIDPERHEQNMARWTFAGSIGVVSGALGLGALVALGFGWRELYLVSGILTFVLLLCAWRMPYNKSSMISGENGSPANFLAGLRGALRALRHFKVLRWLILLELSDLMLDVLYGFLALYMVDVAGVGEAQASLAVAVWTVVGLLGDLLVIPLLERVRGLIYLRISAAVELVLFPAFLLAPDLGLKLVLLGLLGLFNSGWYSILQGQLYSALPGQSGTALAVSSVAGLFGSVIPLIIGLVAERLGLGTAIWLLLAGPIALLVGLPRRPATSGRRVASEP